MAGAADRGADDAIGSVKSRTVEERAALAVPENAPMLEEGDSCGGE